MGMCKKRVPGHYLSVFNAPSKASDVLETNSQVMDGQNSFDLGMRFHNRREVGINRSLEILDIS